jgi:histidyl-tRNA synthetase
VRYAEDHGVDEDGVTTFLQIIDKMERAGEEKTETALAELNLSLEGVKSFIESGAKASGELGQVLSNLSNRGLAEFVEVDLSIVRGLAYYTGPVFEVFDIGKGMRAVAGGGRYDQLVGLIGGVEMPACGFAMGDMVITDLIRETEAPARIMEKGVAREQSIDVFVVQADPEKDAEVLQVVQALRSSGRRVHFSFVEAKVGKQFQAAEQAGADFAVVVGSEYPELAVKNLSERSEVCVSVGALVKELDRLAEG